MERMPSVLFCILDWGIGHATRSIPLIRHLQLEGYEVILGGSGESLNIAGAAFPGLKIIPLPPMKVSYNDEDKKLGWVLLWQLPRLFRALLLEKYSMRRICKKHNIKAIISDNRYGCHHKSIPSVLIIHQLTLTPPSPFSFLFTLLNWIHHKLLRRFDEIWVPDTPAHLLSGDLSRTNKPIGKTKFIGALSRFKEWEKNDLIEDYDLCAILSGPEPQRSILEKKIIQQLQGMQGRYALVRGCPGSDSHVHLTAHLSLFDFLDQETLGSLIERSRVILCRSGYSSLMDFSGSGKKLIMVPTPGQTEQEYLAIYLSESGYALKVSQKDLELARDMEAAMRSTGIPEARNMEHLQAALDELGQLIKNNQICGS